MVLPILFWVSYKVAMKAISSLLLLLLSFSHPALADVYKCRQPDGRTEISSDPCPGGSSTLKSIPDDALPEATVERAEREAERMRNLADKNQAARLAQEKEERAASERAEKQRQKNAPAVVQPVYVPVPYYVTPGYVAPPHRPHPEPIPPGTPENPGKPGKPGKKPDLYTVPKN